MQAQIYNSSQPTMLKTSKSSIFCSRNLSRVPSPLKRSQRGGLRVVASHKATDDTIQRGVERFLQKYDVTSASVGALTVTSYCVWKGQDPFTALSITLAATVAALVINEYVFEGRQ